MSDIIVIPPEQLALASPAEIEQYRLYLIDQAVQADSWDVLLPAVAPDYFSGPFGDHHVQFWEWIWAIKPGHRPHPFVAIWPRGGAKSTSAEAAVAMSGARNTRRYCLYISETQDQANDHVNNIGAILEGEAIAFAFPAVGQRLMGKFGSSKGWTASRLRTASGFTVDAIGLDAAARGIKLESMRPDMMVFDDIDSELDGEHMTSKKIKVITRKLLPAGSQDCAVLAIQNKVHDDSIFAQLADGRADFLRDRQVSGPIPAVWNLGWEERDGKFVITEGQTSWDGFPIENAQGLLNDIGLTAFLAECQHSTVAMSGGIFDHINWPGIHVTEAELPVLKRAVVWLDPAVTSTDHSDCQGIQCDALGADGLLYRLWSWEGRTTPLDAMKRAIRKALEWNADTVGVETNQGGDTWQVVYHQACEELRRDEPDLLPATKSAPRFAEEKASSSTGGKTERAQHMLVDYERNRVRHMVGTHQTLENALMRFPKVKPFDLVDTAYWSWKAIAKGGHKRARVTSAAHVSIQEFRSN